MSHRTVSWNRISRSLHDSRPAIPAGMLGARALVQLGARTRPLVIAGCYDRIIAVLDRMDSDADDEAGADAEPSLAAPENQDGSQVGYMRGGDQDREAEAPEVTLPEVPADAIVIHVPPMRWGGRGNVLAAAGITLLNLVGRSGS